MSEAWDGPRLIIDSNNKAALVVIVTAVGISWTALTLVIRIVSKLHVKRTIGLEELLVVVASFSAFCSSSCLLVAVKHGFGQRTKEVSVDDNMVALKALWATDLFYVIALAIAKGAALPLLIQLTPIRKIVVVCYMLALFTGCWGFASVLVVEARCRIESPWNDTSSATCRSMFERWVAVETIGLFIEVCIFALFAGIISILKMRLMAKINVLLAFSIRLTVIIPAVFRLWYINRGLHADNDALFALADAYIAAQAVLHYTTIASSFAYVRPFLRAFDSNLGATVKVDTVVSTGYLQHSGSAEHDGKVLRKKPRPLSISRTAGRPEVQIGNDGAEATEPTYLRPVTIIEPRSTSPGLSYCSRLFGYSRHSSDDKRSHGEHSSLESMAPIITKTTEWHVQRGDDSHAV